MHPWLAEMCPMPDAIADPTCGRLASSIRLLDLVPIARLPGFRLWAKPDLPLLHLPSRRGLIIGRLRCRDEAASPVGPRDRETLDAIAEGGIGRLLEHHWGSYVAMIRNGPGGAVLRDPSGSMPAYHVRHGARSYVASSPSLLIALGLVHPRIDWDFVRHWLVYVRLRTARTGLVSCRELLPGTLLKADGTIALAWRADRFAGADAQIGDFAAAARLLREELLRTIPASLPHAQHPVLELSGGLDSSIIAAALSHSGRSFSCLTFATRSAEGDERRFARIAAESAGAPLAEVVEPGTDADLLRIPCPRVRPGLSPVLRLLDEALLHSGRKEGADLFISGGGGDNVFCFLTTAAPALDALLRRGPRAAISALTEVAFINGCTSWTAGRYALLNARWHLGRRGWRRETRFLAPALAETPLEQHPWTEQCGIRLPGKREHLAAIVHIFDFLDGSERGRRHGAAYPLLSQPLIETCLRIPSWLWVRGGRDRAVARRAFEGLVPAPILQRRGKGRVESMFVRSFLQHRVPLRELLLDGSLAREGLIDRPATEAYLNIVGDPPDELYYRLFSLATMELWLASWNQSLRS